MQNPRVLVIDDEPSAREALENLLLEDGYLVRTAPSGAAGLACQPEFRPHIVVCDYHLADMDGLQVLRRLRASTGDEVRFILVTAGLAPHDDERALRREADAFLDKPIDLVQLHETLDRLAGPRRDTLPNPTSAKDEHHA
jgi:CheY-like chemotaxis protein